MPTLSPLPPSHRDRNHALLIFVVVSSTALYYFRPRSNPTVAFRSVRPPINYGGAAQVDPIDPKLTLRAFNA